MIHYYHGEQSEHLHSKTPNKLKNTKGLDYKTWKFALSPRQKILFAGQIFIAHLCKRYHVRHFLCQTPLPLGLLHIVQIKCLHSRYMMPLSCLISLWPRLWKTFTGRTLNTPFGFWNSYSFISITITWFNPSTVPQLTIFTSDFYAPWALSIPQELTSSWLWVLSKSPSSYNLEIYKINFHSVKNIISSCPLNNTPSI